MSKAVQMEAREDLVKFPEASLLAQMVESPERASLVAETVMRLHCRRLGFNPWVRKIPWRRE